MGALNAKLRSVEGALFAFWCPGCEEMHRVPATKRRADGWTWNENIEAPTVTPSLLLTSGHFCPDFKPGDNCWCTYNAEQVAKGEKPCKFECERCHTFVKDGNIEFLSDCTHKLAGQTVPIPDWPE